MFIKNVKRIINSLIMLQRRLFSVRVRYAPSPTGFMHIGGLRTAYFNYIFAKKQKGKFIVRIQDTDQQRQVEGSLQNIFETLEWVQAIPDESIHQKGQFGPYIQSQRMSIYKNVQKQLLKSNKAYPCFCKQQKHEQHEDFQKIYDGRCRKLTFEEIKQRIKNKQLYTVRIKSDLIEWPKIFQDQVFGQLQFKPLSDFIIVRSSGLPTFHFANVIDDHFMQITHVLRGEQWLTNTNKHIYLYDILGFNKPKFVHLPIIKAMNGKKLAKRDPQSQVKFFQTGKYEVQAVKNFIYQLGLNRIEPQNNNDQHTQQQILPQKNKKIKKEKKEKTIPPKKQEQITLLTQSQMIKNFNLTRITKSPIKFDIKQLDHLNRLSIHKRWKIAQTVQSQMQYFITNIHKYIPSSKLFPIQYIKRVIANIYDRLNFITDLQLYTYYFEQPDYLSNKSKEDFEKIFGKGSILSLNAEDKSQLTFKVHNYDAILYNRNKRILHTLRMIIEHIIQPDLYNSMEIAKKISQFLVQSTDLKNEDIFHLLRYVVIGRKSGPNITLACQIIGRQIVLKRLSAFSLL